MIRDKNKIFTYDFVLLLLSIPWPIKVSSLGALIFSLLIFFFPIRNSINGILRNKIFVLLIAYYLFIALPYLVAFEREVNYNFITVSLPMMLFPLVFASQSIDEIEKYKSKFLLIFSIGITLGFSACLFLALYKFWNEFYLFKNGYSPVTSLIGMHPSDLSLFASFSFVIVLNHLINKWKRQNLPKKVLFCFWLSFLAFAIFYIRSRTGIASFILLLLFIIIYKSPKKYWLALTLTLSALILSGYLIIEMTSFHKGRFLSNQIAKDIKVKAKQWDGAIKVIRENIFFGVSAIKAQDELNKEYRAIGFEEGANFNYDPHNQYLNSLVIGGIFGFLLLFAPFILLLQMGLMNRDFVTVGFFFLTALAFSTESMLERHKGIIFFTVFLCLLGANFSTKVAKTT